MPETRTPYERAADAYAILFDEEAEDLATLVEAWMLLCGDYFYPYSIRKEGKQD